MPPVGLAECLRPGVRAATLCSRTRQQNQGWLCESRQREFWPSGHRTKESYASGGTPPQRNSAAVMSRGMVMAESSVVTATIRVLNR